VLLGESANTGFPILYTSHGLGSLVFGEDGTLLASCGDGGTQKAADMGNAPGTYYAQGIAEGIIQPKENVGSFRAQMTSSLARKVIRIDPATGDGLPSNPFFDPAQPRSARSRIWALGLRQPFRLTLRPGTGSHLRSDGRPGVLYIGDVG
jgi:glucose/arabinose dehydrogenase